MPATHGAGAAPLSERVIARIAQGRVEPFRAVAPVAVGPAIPSAGLSRRVLDLFVLHKDYMTVRRAYVFSSVRPRNWHLRGRASLVGDVFRRTVGRVKPEGTVVESMGNRWDRV